MLWADGDECGTVTNAVTYCLYDVHLGVDARDDSEERLQELQKNILLYAKELIHDYIWQKDEFGLSIWMPYGEVNPPWQSILLYQQTHCERSSGSYKINGNYGRKELRHDKKKRGEGRTPCLWGVVEFEDNVDDEWFVVWILRSISEKFAVAVRVWDNDGEFLLIEAAYSLPAWLKPEIAENRIWFLNGRIHCVPVVRVPACGRTASSSIRSTTTEILSVSDALDILKSRQQETKALGADIDACICRKLDAYPQYARDTMHTAPVILPEKLALLMSSHPGLSSKAVRAFLGSTPKERRIGGMFRYFTPSKSSMVPMAARFNRYCYAGIALFDMARLKTWPDFDGGDGDLYDNASLLGMKIALGFEILLLTMDKDYVDPETCSMLKRMSDTKELSKEQKIIISSISLDSEGMEHCTSDESWLHTASEYLENELNRREEELQAAEDFDPKELSSRMKRFVDTTSGFEGADIPLDEVHLHPDVFLKELEKLTEQRVYDDACPSSEEGSSFYDGSAKEDSDACSWDDIITETDSDDEFYEEYEEALVSQLKETTLASTFTTGSSSEDHGNATVDNPLTPIDLDVHVVSDLLSSYEEQGSLPGPASNLAALLGVSLPHVAASDNAEAAPSKP